MIYHVISVFEGKTRLKVVTDVGSSTKISSNPVNNKLWRGNDAWHLFPHFGTMISPSLSGTRTRI
jgi:hypothetical protein